MAHLAEFREKKDCVLARNPCKICLQPVKLSNGVRCLGACEAWAHFKCLNYTPGKIKDIKAGKIKINCPCPDCKTTGPRETVVSTGSDHKDVDEKKKNRKLCTICKEAVTLSNGLRCMGACQTWVHFKCLNYTPGKIHDIKMGYKTVNCPCPICRTPDPIEIAINDFTCTNVYCPANNPPACENYDCCANEFSRAMPAKRAPPGTLTECGSRRCLQSYARLNPYMKPGKENSRIENETRHTNLRKTSLAQEARPTYVPPMNYRPHPDPEKEVRRTSILDPRKDVPRPSMSDEVGGEEDSGPNGNRRESQSKRRRSRVKSGVLGGFNGLGGLQPGLGGLQPGLGGLQPGLGGLQPGLGGPQPALGGVGGMQFGAMPNGLGGLPGGTEIAIFPDGMLEPKSGPCCSKGMNQAVPMDMGFMGRGTYPADYAPCPDANNMMNRLMATVKDLAGQVNGIAGSFRCGRGNW